MRHHRLWLVALASLPLFGVSECGEPCSPSDGEVVFDASPDDLADYGVDNPDDVDEDTCISLCEDSSGMVEVVLCESEDAGDGYATIHCEGTFDC
jgi:hypothetical protein